MTAPTRVSRRSGVLAMTAMAVLAACSGDSSAPPVPTTFEASGPPLESARVGSTVVPAVRVLDENGDPLPDVTVTFEVTAGGGSVANSTATTNANGVASPGAWTLGTTVGTNTLVARSGALSPLTISVTARADVPASIEPLPDNITTAVAGAPLPVPPGVIVHDRFGNPVQGVELFFNATSGSGSVTQPIQLTGADGIARPGGWTLGTSAGTQTLTVTTTGLSTQLSVDATAPAVFFDAFAGDGTTCPVASTDCLFAVRVRTGGGEPISGAQIEWRNGAALDTTLTNSRGIATGSNVAPSATAGSGSVTARLLTTGDEVTFGYDNVIPGGFDIDIRFIGNSTPSQQAIVRAAADRWEEVITGDVPEAAVFGVPSNECGINHPAVGENVDDVLIFIEIVPIDSVGNTLGSAGPCRIRTSNDIPALGAIKLDLADVANMETQGILFDVVAHEIAHVLGFGTLWSEHDFVGGSGTQTPRYIGARARPAYAVIGGIDLGGVPVENTGGTGTRESHWLENGRDAAIGFESGLGFELMTGFVDRNAPGGLNPLSIVTIAALMDLGYEVNFGAADPFVLGFAALRAAADPSQRIQLVEVPLPPPMWIGH